MSGTARLSPALGFAKLPKAADACSEAPARIAPALAGDVEQTLQQARRRALGDRRAPHRREFPEDLRDVRARCKNKSVERRRLLVVVACHLDAIAESVQRSDDAGVPLLAVRRDQQVVDAPFLQGVLTALEHLGLVSLNVGVQNVDLRQLPV